MKANSITHNGLYRHDVRKFPIVASLDVHDRSHFVKIVDVATSKTLFFHNVLGSLEQVASVIDRHCPSKVSVLILYEAGGLGFYPYRFFTDRGYACLVIAPGSIPQNNRRRKTDKRDCSANLDYHLSGLLRYVVVPGKDSEDVRDCQRYRDTLACRIVEQQQRITGFVKRHGHFFDLTKTTWTVTHRRWLHGLQLSDTLRLLLHHMLDELALLESHLKKIEATLAHLVSVSPRYAFEVAAYKLLPGIGQNSAITLAFEGGDLSRFKHPKAVASFIGLIPSKCSSGTSDPHLSITKEGNKHLRKVVVSASKFYGDQRKIYPEKDIVLLPESVQPFLRKMQDRLRMRYRYLRSQGKHTNKIRCAIARELSMFLWEYRVTVMPLLAQAEEWKMAA